MDGQGPWQAQSALLCTDTAVLLPARSRQGTSQPGNPKPLYAACWVWQTAGRGLPPVQDSSHQTGLLPRSLRPCWST
jgi:hypothetical protein